MGRRIKEHEDVAQALLMLEQVTALLDAAGLAEIAVQTDYAKQMLDQTILMMPLSESLPAPLAKPLPKPLDSKDT